MKPKPIVPGRLSDHYSIVPYQSTHTTGGAVMGTDPKTSVVNRYLQSWDVPNLFVFGASAFPQNPGYNPTGHGRRPRLLGGAGDPRALPESARAAGAGIMMRFRTLPGRQSSRAPSPSRPASRKPPASPSK